MNSETLRSLLFEYNKIREPEALGSFCHAPSVSLNFDQAGNATACCYNRRFILGAYPRNTIQEIWEGERIKILRQHISELDLTHGCQGCMHQLESRNFANMRAKAFDGKNTIPGLKPSDKLVPRLMEFELSNACNLECIMCNGFFSSSIRVNREKLEPVSQVYDDAFVEQLRPFIPYLHQARFLGGEPFLNPLYFKIWDLIAELNPKIDVVITTNASIMNKRIENFLAKILPTIVVSCDSLHKETYEKIRLNANYESMRRNLDILLQSSRVSKKALAIAVCPMAQNWETIPEILEFCNENGAVIGFNTTVWPKEVSLKYVPKAQLREIADYLAKACPDSMLNDQRWWVRFNHGVYHGMVNEIRFWSEEAQAV